MTVLLVANKVCLKKFIRLRGRGSEKNEKTLKRSLEIQTAFVRLVQEEKNVLVIDRSYLDFSKSSDVQKVLKKISRILK